MLQRKYTFPIPTLELTSIIAQYSAACQQCQVLKSKNVHHGTLDYIPVPPTIFTSLCMDFLSLDRCEDTFGQAYDFVFVSVCRLSGYTLAIPCLKAGLTAQKLAHMFFYNCLTITRLLNNILSDNDKLITSEFFQTLCELTGIEQHMAIIYRPQGNGRAEAAVRLIIQSLRMVLLSFQATLPWIHALPWATYLLNIRPGPILPYSLSSSIWT